MRITITYPTSARRSSVHASLVSDLFGIAGVVGPHVVAESLDLAIESGMVVAFTGPSGSGKSSLLRAASAELETAGELIVRLDELLLPSVNVIDALGTSFDRATGLLSSCGLAEPRLMLRRPCELSDGERWRFRLALALAKSATWIIADEFTASLDRTLAKVVAFNIRRQCDKTGTGFLVATCHDDVIDDLRPDLHVRCDHDGAISVKCRETASEQERSCSASHTSSKSRPERRATGRTSLGGITGRIGSAECGS